MVFLYPKKSILIEVDYITSIDGEISVVEVIETSGNSIALKTILKNNERYNENEMNKFGANNGCVDGEKITHLYYMVYLF